MTYLKGPQPSVYIYDEIGKYMRTGKLDPIGETQMSADPTSREAYYPAHARLIPDPFADDNEFVSEDKARVDENTTRAMKAAEVVHRIATLVQQKKKLDKAVDEAKNELKGLTVKDTDYQVGNSKVSVYTVTGRTFNVPKLKTMITPELFAEVTKTTIDTKKVDKAFEAGRITPNEMVSVVTFKDSKAIKVTTKPEGDTA